MHIIHPNVSGSNISDLFDYPVSDSSDAELRQRLWSKANGVRMEKFAKGGYLTYYDPAVCPTTSHAVHEYSDRKELMRIDNHGQEHLVKIL